MANQAEVLRILGQIKDASDIDIESRLRDRLIEVIGQALDTGSISASEIVAFYAGKSTIADGTVELLTRIESVGAGEATRALPPPISPGVQAPVDGTPTTPSPTPSASEGLITPQELAVLLGDPDLATAPQAVVEWIDRINEELGFLGEAFFADYNPDSGEITFTNKQGEPIVYTIMPNGSIVPKEIAGTGTANDIARNNLQNMQAAQIAALMSGDLIPLEDGRSIIRGTTTIVDTRTPGQFAPIEGIPGTFYDPVTGSFIDQNGQQLARDRFEFEQNFIFPEEQRQFDEGQALDRENIQAQNRRSVLSSLVNLQGQSDARGIAGAQAAGDPGNFIAAENIRRGIAPPEQGETPLFPDVDFGGIGLADVIAGLFGGGASGSQASRGIAGAVAPTSSSGTLSNVAQDVAPGTPQSAINALEGADRPTTLGISPLIAERLGLTGQTQLDLTDPANVELARSRDVALPPGFAHGGSTTEAAFQVGDPVPGSTKANPEMILNPEQAPIQVIRLSDIIKDLPRFFAGTSTGLGTAAAPQDFPELRQDPTAPVVRTTADVDIQQTPGLRFIQGGQGAEDDFNRLSTSTIEGPFGTGLPLAGALNFTRAQEALQDPITGPLLSSLFRAASMNFAGEVARARKRAPTGQSLATSLVRT